MERFRRLKTHGENYSEEMIRKRISQKSIAEYKHIDMPKDLGLKVTEDILERRDSQDYRNSILPYFIN